MYVCRCICMLVSLISVGRRNPRIYPLIILRTHREHGPAGLVALPTLISVGTLVLCSSKISTSLNLRQCRFLYHTRCDCLSLREVLISELHGVHPLIILRTHREHGSEGFVALPTLISVGTLVSTLLSSYGLTESTDPRVLPC